MAYFSERDRAIVEALKYDATLKPGYESIKGCLIWADERAENLTSEGYEKLSDLWICRSCIHRGDPTFSKTLAPAYFQKAWADAQADNIQWPGFKRLSLSAADRAYWEKCEKEEAESGEI